MGYSISLSKRNGSLEHEFWKQKVKQMLIQNGCSPEKIHEEFPIGKAVPSPQLTQVPIGLKKDFLSHILCVMEVAKLSIYVGIDAFPIFVYKHAESSRLSVKTFLNHTAIFCSHFKTPDPDSQVPLPIIRLPFSSHYIRRDKQQKLYMEF